MTREFIIGVLKSIFSLVWSQWLVWYLNSLYSTRVTITKVTPLYTNMIQFYLNGIMSIL